MIGRTVIKNVRLCAWISVCLGMPLKKCSNKILHIETEELNKLKLKDNQIEIQSFFFLTKYDWMLKFSSSFPPFFSLL